MSLKTWVSDQLHEVCGFSESTVCDFAIALANQSKDVESLRKGLSDLIQKRCGRDVCESTFRENKVFHEIIDIKETFQKGKDKCRSYT